MSRALLPLPVLPVSPAAPFAYIPYAGPSALWLSPLVRAGRLLSFAAGAAALLFLPLWAGVSDADARYGEIIPRVVPLLQMFLSGAGLSLTMAGRRSGGGAG